MERVDLGLELGTSNPVSLPIKWGGHPCWVFVEDKGDQRAKARTCFANIKKC